MNRRVVWSRGALNDLKQVGRYIAQDNPAAARKVAAAIRNSGDLLGEAATGRRGRVSGTYEKSVPRLPYILAYERLSQPDGGEIVVILHVIHAARNWPDNEWP